ncbi:Protein of unknown function [Desulfopila aestuarii DSM 18488]|uniref:DUF1214 domain-containing protein n=2 Tax=Desulfopila aestuarii TaxID=231440 RepID=A0A1M7YM98_9BACT|nr:Protein of unknown function [Desulfopila aestuarii DSM 18488]
MIQTDQRFLCISSQNKNLLVNNDGSVDVYFCSKAPENLENNWIQMIPDKSLFMILRLYGPLKPWFDKMWRPNKNEVVK